jgi:hypothetical protein
VKSILAGYVLRGFLGSWTLFVKTFGLAFSVASGLSLGKEGPFVHIAASCANLLTRCFSKVSLLLCVFLRVIVNTVQHERSETARDHLSGMRSGRWGCIWCSVRLTCHC